MGTFAVPTIKTWFPVLLCPFFDTFPLPQKGHCTLAVFVSILIPPFLFDTYYIAFLIKYFMTLPEIPCFVVESNARGHNEKRVWEVPYEAGDELVFERGYTDYGYFVSICQKKAYFVTRLKNNVVSNKRVKKKAIKEGGNIISDYEISILSMPKELRLRTIIACDPETKERVVLLTNNLKWSAQTVVGVYKERWQIELFFKAVKQNLKIKGSMAIQTMR